MSAEIQESRLTGERFRRSRTQDLLDYMGRIISGFVTLAAGLEVPYFEMRKMAYSFLGGEARWGVEKSCGLKDGEV